MAARQHTRKGNTTWWAVKWEQECHIAATSLPDSPRGSLLQGGFQWAIPPKRNEPKILNDFLRGVHLCNAPLIDRMCSEQKLQVVETCCGAVSGSIVLQHVRLYWKVCACACVCRWVGDCCAASIQYQFRVHFLCSRRPLLLGFVWKIAAIEAEELFFLPLSVTPNDFTLGFFFLLWSQTTCWPKFGRYFFLGGGLQRRGLMTSWRS